MKKTVQVISGRFNIILTILNKQPLAGRIVSGY